MNILKDKKIYAGLNFGLMLDEEAVKTMPFYAKKKERGVALVTVLILSAVALALMTALIYLITSGIQISGAQKRYKTALEAGIGGYALFSEVMGYRGQTVDTTTFMNSLAGLTPSLPAMTSSCTGSSMAGTTYSGWQAKLMTPSTSWGNCFNSISIDPNDSTTYDMKLVLGSLNKYNVYYKIVATVEGNTGATGGFINSGVVGAGSGEIPVQPQPYLYAVEAMALNSSNPSERAKLSILYQY